MSHPPRPPSRAHHPSPTRTSLDYLSFPPPPSTPAHYIPIARRIGSAPRTYPRARQDEQSALQYETLVDGTRVLHEQDGKWPRAHQRLFEGEDSDDSDEEWDTDEEDERFKRKAAETRARRRYAEHHRTAFHNGDPLERRLSAPERNPKRKDTPPPGPLTGDFPRPPPERRGSVHLLSEHRSNLIDNVRADMQAKPVSKLTARDMRTIEQLQTPREFGVRQLPTARRDFAIAERERLRKEAQQGGRKP